MPTFRKRPILVHAMRYATPEDCQKIHDFMGDHTYKSDASMCGGGSPIALDVCGVLMDLPLGGWVVREPLLDGSHVFWPLTDDQFHQFHFREESDTEAGEYYAQWTPLTRAGFKISALISVAEERNEPGLKAELEQLLAWLHEAEPALRIDAAAGAACLAVQSGVVHHTLADVGGVNADFDAHGNLLGIEFTGWPFQTGAVCAHVPCGVCGCVIDTEGYCGCYDNRPPLPTDGGEMTRSCHMCGAVLRISSDGRMSGGVPGGQGYRCWACFAPGADEEDDG